ncbi:MAG: sodium:calcium exchanger [Allomuricauda sp.]|nr:MAG: sodium:calcium exchanger [Allomuricauda sp.]
MGFKYKLLAFLFLASAGLFGQATITIEVNWPNWSSENRVTFRDPSNVQIGASICNPAACFNGAGNNSYNNIGSPATYAGVAYGTGYDILLEDTWGDGWNGGASYVRVYQDGILIVDTDLTGGTSTVFTFDILAPTPALSVDDVSIAENGGSATFTVTHLGANTTGAFTANFNTNDGSATAGDDYTATSGTLSFNGTVGDTEQIVVPILDDTLFDGDETFTISFTAVSDLSVDITDTATGTITDDETVLNDQPLTLYQQLNGYYDYAVTGGTFRTNSNGVNACSITNTSSATGLTTTVPATATIERAYLIWAHSSQTQDIQVTFQGQTVDAQLVSSYFHSSNRDFYGMVADVTSIIQAETDVNTATYTLTDLTIDNSATYCNSATVLGGWSLLVFYEELSLPAVTINFYNGFDGGSNATSTFTLSGFYAIGSVGSKTTVLSWEGDDTLANNENLQFITASSGSNILSGDGGQTGTNPFNSTIYDNTAAPVVNNANIYGVDLDTYDVSAFLQQGESSATTRVQVGQDLVIMNSVLLKVPSNLITGTVFEDVNYGGGNGRNLATSSGQLLSGVTVELYDSGGTLFDTQITDSNGAFTFGGMANGSYDLRAANTTVRSTRPGGSSCTSCLPIQTFRTNFAASAISEVTTEVGGANPAGVDTNVGILPGAQSVSSVTINSEGAIGMDFGFNFNTIVNTNEDDQGSLEQFIVNSNNLGETGLDIEANSIFDPAAGDDTSIFVIPSSGDPMGRTADANFASGYFDIAISNGNPLSDITGANTIIDGRTQTAYSGDTNSGTIGSGGSTVGVSGNTLPNYQLPEIQVHRDNGDVFVVNGNTVGIRNMAIYGGNNAGIRLDGGYGVISANLLGVNALGVNAGNIDDGVENLGGNMTVDGNYIATNTDAGIFINGGTLSVVQDNHITTNGDGSCDDNITINGGSGITIQRNLIENAASLGIDAASSSGSLVITENTITGSGQDGGNCGGAPEDMGTELGGSNSQITNNIIHSNAGAGIATTGSGTGNLFSQNSFYANGTTSDALGIDLAGDGITLNDSGDSDSGSNNLQNFPIIASAYISGNSIMVHGWSRPGATLEFFFTDINQGTATAGDNQLGLSVDYGEGQTFIGSAIEGSGSDGDATSSAYTDVDGNTDNTNRFEFAIPLPSGTVPGNLVTATATLGGSTSEFSPMSILKVATIITNRRITYRINPN